MTALGADPEALDGLAAELCRAGTQLDAVAARAGRTLARTGWDGPDAERFRRAWQVHHRRGLLETADGLTTAASTLRRQADEQRRASSSGAAGAAGTRGAAGAAPTAPALDPLPASVDVLSGGLQVTVGPVAASIAGTLAIEHLGHGRVRVGHTDQVGAGASGGAGASAGIVVDDRVEAAGSSASVTAQLQGSTTRWWELREQDLPGLLLGLAAEGTVAGLPFRAVDLAAQGVDDALSFLGVDAHLGTTASFPAVPDPDRVEELAGVTTTGGATASARPLAGTGGGSGELVAGLASDGERRSLVVESRSSIAGALGSALRRALGATLTGVPSNADVTVRLEAPVTGRAEDRRPIVATLRSGTGADLTVVRAAVDPRAAGNAAARLQAAADRLGRGDAEGAVRELAAVRLPAGAVTVDVSTGHVDRTSLSLPVQGSVASVTATGTRTTVTYP